MATAEQVTTSQGSDLKTAHAQAQADVRRLRNRALALTQEIDKAAEAAKKGAIAGSRRMDAVTAELSQVETELRTAQRELDSATVALNQFTRAEEAKRFHALLGLISDERAAVVQHVRAAALAAGAMHELLKELRGIAGGLNSPLWPMVREAEKPIAPYEHWNVRYLPVEFDRLLRVKPVRPL